MLGGTYLGRGLAVGAGVALLGLAYWIYRRRDQPAAGSFVSLLSILGVTALCAGATAHTGTPYKLVWLYTSLAIPLALTFFAFDYYGIGFFASRSRTIAALAPAVAGAVGGSAVVLGTPAMSPGSVPPVDAVAALPSVALDLARTLNQLGLYYTTALVLLAVGLVLRTVYRYDHLDVRLGPVVAFIGGWPWTANLFVPQLAASSSPGVGVLAVAVGYTGSAVVAAAAVGPLRLFASSPMAGNVGPATVLDSLDDPVIVVDDAEHVLRLNAAACRTFGTAERQAVGGPLDDLVDVSLAALRADAVIAAETVDGVRHFEVTRSAVTDRAGVERGYAVVLRDVTRRQTREQRLEVFSRVLRHNLRNDATSIIGHAQLIEDGGDPERSVERIVDTTRDLVGAAERAREIERMLSAPANEERTAVRPAIADVVGAVEAAYPAVEITTALPDGAVAAAAPSAFEIVIRNLIENAAEHNDADDPIVVVSGELEDGSLRLAVADNGPGIPEQERRVIDAGTEEPLQHGSGLGLWAASWGVTRFGGTLSFGANDPRGTVVTVTVPAAEGVPPDPPADTGEGVGPPVDA